MRRALRLARRRCLARLLVVTLLGAGAAARAQSDRDVAALEARLELHPEDVDLRLRLATWLSWRGERGEARRHVLRVVTQVPRYWDAQLLLARLDAWEGHYAAAKARAEQVLRAAPDSRPVLWLLLDIAIWAERPKEALRLVHGLLARERSAELYYRLALAEQQRMRGLAAYRATRRALALDPLHRGAAGLREELRLVQVDLTYELDVFPIQSDRFAHGELLSVSVLPRSFFSGVLYQELRYRFGTWNHRLLLQLDLRPLKWLTLSAVGGGAAPAEAVPRATASVQGLARLGGEYDASLRYQYDRLPWAGDLHTLRFGGGVALPRGFRAEAAYLLGMLAHCRQVDVLHALHLKGIFEHRRLRATVQYGYGSQLDRPTLRTAPTGQVDASGCPTGSAVNPEPPLLDLRSHDLGFDLYVQLVRSFGVRGGYDLQLRFNGTEAHLVHVGGRYWF
ncbi:MAG: hypothetical protein IT371_10875 [Deltaproteobacteria bacterium]|nr:hypothetical protein [Deltaproteobacteria bacterium]